MLIKRIISSILVLLPAGLVIFLFPNWVFLFVVVGVIAMALNEFFSIIEGKGIFVYKHFGIIAGCLIPVSIYLHLGGNYMDLEPLLIVLACLFAFVLQFIKRENAKDHIVSIAVTLLALFYIAWFFSFFMKLKFLPNGNLLVTFLIVVTKSGDVGAYFVGKATGRHKLIPRISPKKTVEGTIGGLITSVCVAMLCRNFIGVGIGYVFLLGIFLGAVGQVGDLAESLIKRDCGVKDAGEKMPGFGGMLDMIDSLLFTTPIFYFYVKIFLK